MDAYAEGSRGNAAPMQAGKAAAPLIPVEMSFADVAGLLDYRELTYGKGSASELTEPVEVRLSQHDLDAFRRFQWGASASECMPSGIRKKRFTVGNAIAILAWVLATALAIAFLWNEVA